MYSCDGIDGDGLFLNSKLQKLYRYNYIRLKNRPLLFISSVVAPFLSIYLCQ